MANSNRKGKTFERRIANEFKHLYPEARRGNQDRLVTDEADVEKTPFWIECKDHARIAAFRFWDKAEADRKNKDDQRPIMVVMKESRPGRPSPVLAMVELSWLLEQIGRLS